MTGPAPDACLTRVLCRLSAPGAAAPLNGEVTREPLPSSREVYRFTFCGNGTAVVGKFFSGYPPEAPADKGLAQEYDNYLQAAALGLGRGSRRIPRLLGRHPESRLGLLLEAVPGPDLDTLLKSACLGGELTPLYRGLENLAGLLADFHSRPLPEAPASGLEALDYFGKLRLQLHRLGLLTDADQTALAEARAAWETRLGQFPDRQVLVHGDATPTNFLFPDEGGRGRPPYGRAVALDLERLRPADRLWDLSFLAGELKHAWAWRTGNAWAAEAAINHFFQAYLAVLPGGPPAAGRLFRINPFYMALAELRIARNSYLRWDHRRWLVAEARRCLYHGRQL